MSVIIPTYNAASHIGETLLSILNQGIEPNCIVVVNDGSTDSTEQAILETHEFHGIQYISTPNRGQGAARQLGISKVSSDYIFLCDSDDIWTPNHLQRKSQLLEQFPEADFTFSNCYSFGASSDGSHNLLDEAPPGWAEHQCEFGQDGFYIIRQPYLALLDFNPAYPSGVMFRRESYQRMGGFLEKYSRWIGEDSEFTRRFASLDDCVFVGDTQPTWGYRRHSSNYSAVQWKNIKAKADILEEHLRLGVVPPSYVGATCAERDATRGAAFDQACWEKASGHVADLFLELPPAQRTAKRRAKALLAKAGVFF
ncbi:MAG: glycosyltransferase family 2 protein [Halieaceae bacterium]|uniref:glycosyltransferase family 2 protein n=1 Tax=Haliea alexandrii TaxID=2448162 RepID=UPI000F0B68AB|nr:glycosyltransferase family 2 protein [Haliea alexandrii]MCR9186204.1 glycosyltransferase family 2 protein [Halieaceae bacterium]